MNQDPDDQGLAGGLRTFQLSHEDTQTLAELLHRSINGTTLDPRIGFVLLVCPFRNPFGEDHETRHVVSNMPADQVAELLEAALAGLEAVYGTRQGEPEQ